MDFEEIVREMEALQRRMTEAMFGDFEDLEKSLETGEVQGEWRIEPIEGPGVRGFIARGFFRTPEPLERPPGILPPLKPPLDELRKPLYDIDVGEDALQLYIELPGVEEGEIEIKADPKNFEVKAGSFHANIDLSRWTLDTDRIATEYRNGVLDITIPKKKTEEHLI